LRIDDKKKRVHTHSEPPLKPGGSDQLMNKKLLKHLRNYR
jgi:hypothetical protein